MTPKQIGAAYDQITHLWLSDEFNSNNGIAAHQYALSFLDRRDNATALDIGCGCQGRILNLLTEQGFDYTGVDISAEMLALARQRFPQHRFMEGDITTWDPPHQYHFISAWDCLWHVALDQQAAVITRIINMLSPHGVFVFSVGGTALPDEHTNCYMGPTLYYGSLGMDGYHHVIAESGAKCKHVEFDQAGQEHVYFIVQRAI